MGIRISIPPRGKEIRAEPFAAAWQGGNVYAVAGAWIADFLEEAEPWPGQMFPLGNIRQPLIAGDLHQLVLPALSRVVSAPLAQLKSNKKPGLPSRVETI